VAQIPKIIDFLGRDPYKRDLYKKETENLGDKIREYRRIHGLSQKKLAEQLQIDQTTLAGWERGEHRPAKKQLEKLRSIFTLFKLK
jgi:ribosome-binding protein aMBF1 (putative translation factor)